MSAFALQPTGPPVHCDFRGCILEAWHDGEHQFPAPAFLVPKNTIHFSPANEGAKWEVPLMCRCPQREYPHDLSIHGLIRSEWWSKERRTQWPWSLMASLREEPSTERKAA